MSGHVLAADRLKRALERSAEIAGCTVDVVKDRAERFDFAMFEGGKHSLTIVVGGPARASWLDTLDEYTVHLPGYALCSLEVGAVEEKDGRLVADVEALTVKEA